ncbi:MAG: hypothetical protein M5U01_00265 [Ardenticatenaceae bacterium]|nr:hypothetical protein [Ardenticatenaceae bacterium]
MDCPTCGYDRLPARARVCPNCGASVAAAPSPAAAKIIDYRTLIARSTADFVGRQWVRDAADAFLKADGPRSFLLLGEPGSGKTSFLADLVRRRGYPHHFIGRGSRIDLPAVLDWRNPVRFAESIGYQLLRDYGGWIMDWPAWGITISQNVKELDGLLVGAQVGEFRAKPRPPDRPVLTVNQEVKRFGPAAQAIGVYIERFVLDVEQIVRQLLTTPLQAIANRWPEHQIVIVVDGLDEAEDYSSPQRTILKLLPNGSLPPNVRFILSSRPGKHLTPDFMSQVQPFWLSEGEAGDRDPRTIEDAKAYVEQLAEGESVAAMLTRRRIEPDAFREQVARSSQGNFLYLYHYAQGVRSGDETLLDLERLPEGLFGIYADFLGKIEEKREDVPWDGAYKPVLGTLAVAQEPLARRQIASFSGVPPTTVGTILTRLKPFLDTAGTGTARRYSIYHSSFGEYLVSEENEDYIEGREAHTRIVAHYRDRYWGDWSKLAQDEYARRHLATHMVSAGLHEALYALIHQGWMRARFAADHYTYTGFLADVDLAWHAARSQARPHLPMLARFQTARQLLALSASTTIDLETLARLGRVDEALTQVQLENDLEQRFEKLMAIDATLKEAGRRDQTLLDEALDGARAFEDSAARARALGDLAVVLAEAGDGNSRIVFDEARAAARAVGYDHFRAAALCEVAAAMAQAGDDRAGLAFDEAVEVAHGLESEVSQAETLGKLAVALALSGRYDGAVEAAHAIRRDWERAEALRELAVVLLKAGDVRADAIVDQAWEAARTMQEEYGWQRAIALRHLAVALARVGDRRADPVFDEAIRVTHSIRNEWHRSEELSDLAAALAHAGRFDQAAALIGSVQGDWEREEARNALVAALARAGRFGEAAEIVHTIQEEGAETKPLRELSAALARAGRFDEAAEAGRAIRDDWGRAEALIELARALVQAGDDRVSAVFEEAAEAVRMMEDGRVQSWMLSDLAEVLVQARRWDEAAETARSIWGEEERLRALHGVAAAMNRAGERRAGSLFEEAAETERSLEDLRVHAVPFRELVAALTQAGRFDEAMVLARSIQLTWERVTALSELGVALAQTDESKARTVLDEALALGRNAPRFAAWEKPSLHDLERALASTGRFEELAELAQLIQEKWGRSPGERWLVAVVARLFPGLANRKLFHSGDWLHAEALRTLVAGLVQAGRLDEAAEITRSIQVDWERAAALRELATALAQAGDRPARPVFDEALQVARSVQDDERRAAALRALAAALARAGDRQADSVFGEAAASVASIPYERERAKALRDLTAALAQARRFDEAAEIARTIEDGERRAEALAELAVAIAQAGDRRARWIFDEAAQATRAVEGRGLKAKALCELAAALAQAGDRRAGAVFGEAAQVARTLQNHVDRTNALRALGAALARDGRFEAALVTVGPDDLDDFIRSLADWAPYFENVEPGLSLAVLREASEVAGWVRRDWREIHELLSAQHQGGQRAAEAQR